MEQAPKVSTRFQRMLVGFDDFPMSALYRAAIGFAVVPLSQEFGKGGSAYWRLLFSLLVVLLALRAVPAVLRRLLPYPPDAVAVWTHRRRLAKEFDSYQWRKLIWIGIGMGAYGLQPTQRTVATSVIAAIVVAAGLLGELAWRSAGSKSAGDSA